MKFFSKLIDRYMVKSNVFTMNLRAASPPLEVYDDAWFARGTPSSYDIHHVGCKIRRPFPHTRYNELDDTHLDTFLKKYKRAPIVYKGTMSYGYDLTKSHLFEREYDFIGLVSHRYPRIQVHRVLMRVRMFTPDDEPVNLYKYIHQFVCCSTTRPLVYLGPAHYTLENYVFWNRTSNILDTIVSGLIYSNDIVMAHAANKKPAI